MTVDIGLVSGSGYDCGLFVTAASIAMFANRMCEIRFNIIEGGIPDDDFACYRKMLSDLHPHVSVNRFKVSEEMFADFPPWRGNRLAYARFLFPKLLQGVKYLVYSDVDIVWCADVCELVKSIDGNFAVHAVHDEHVCGNKALKEWYCGNNYTFPGESYFCSGMMVMNLDRFRKDNVIEKAGKVLNRHLDVPFADQDALNIVLSDSKSIVDKRWMRFTCDVTQADVENSVVLHYTNDLPWKRIGIQGLTDLDLVWHRINAKARNISVWRSLRSHFSIKTIIFRRLLFLLTSSRLGRVMLVLPCKLIGRAGYVSYFREWNKRIKLADKIAERMR